MTSILTYILILSILIQINTYLTIRNNRIFDQQNGQRIFHGLNVVEKQFPYISKFNQTDMQLFKSWGINGIRLGVMWPGVEPKQGQYNQTYLRLMSQTVQLAAKYNIYTLVEFHQDLFSQKFCADGVPLWAIPKSVYESFPQPLSKRCLFDPKTGLPPASACQKYSWGTYYTTYAVNKGFNHLWTNKNGLLQKFGKYWKKVADTFKENKNVIAYQLINEPWPGNMYTNPLIMIPSISQLAHMSSAYDYLSNQIRSIDPNHNICYEPVTWLNGINAGFQHPPGGFKYSNSSILCYHYYKPPSINPKLFMKARMSDIKRLKSAGILSQFYVEGEEGQKNIEMMQLCDQNSQSWFGWCYTPASSSRPSSFFKDNNYNQPNKVLLDLITRTYAQRIAGQLIHQQFNNNTKRYTLSYYHCSNCGETIIYFSQEYQYVNGYRYECYPKDITICTIEENQYLKVKSIGPDKGQIMITIQAV